MRLKEVEDQILESISSAEGDLLANTTLIEGLERTKATGSEITARQVPSSLSPGPSSQNHPLSPITPVTSHP